MNKLLSARTVGLTAIVSMVGALIVVAILALTGNEARAGVELWENDRVVDSSMPAQDAVAEASRKVGFPVRQPQDLPLRIYAQERADVGPTAPDQTGVIRDLSFSRSVTLQYKDEAGGMIAIEQLAPERKVVGVSESMRLDSVAQGVDAFLLEREVVTYLTWDSPTASYLAVYHHPGQAFPDAEQMLTTLLESMR